MSSRSTSVRRGTPRSPACSTAPHPPGWCQQSTPPPSAPLSSALLVEIVGDDAQHSGHVVAGRLFGIAIAAQSVRNAVEQLDEVFDDDDHFVGLLALRRRDCLHDGRRGVEDADRQRLLAPLALGHTELDPAARLQRFEARRQGRRVHEDVTAVVAGNKAEALFGVVPLDLAGRHGEALQKLMRMEVGEVEPASLPVAATPRRLELRLTAFRLTAADAAGQGAVDAVGARWVGLQTSRAMPDNDDYER